MAAQKFLTIVAGVLTEIASKLSSAGAGDAGAIPALDAAGKLDISFMPDGLGADTVSCDAKEALSAGNLVNFVLDGGALKAQKADCSNGRRADGYVKAAVDLGDTATVYKSGTITDLTGKTIGAQQYLSTGGGTAETPTTTSGQIVQEIGKALSATTSSFEPQQPVTLA